MVERNKFICSNAPTVYQVILIYQMDEAVNQLQVHIEVSIDLHLLYTGKLIFKNIVKNDYYNHLLCLNIIISIYSSKITCRNPRLPR